MDDADEAARRMIALTPREMAERPDEHGAPKPIATKRVIGHDEARDVARRFIHGHFRHARYEGPRIAIPADTERDDDILLLSYIAQCRTALLASQERVRKLETERQMLRTILSEFKNRAETIAAACGELIDDIDEQRRCALKETP